MFKDQLTLSRDQSVTRKTSEWTMCARVQHARVRRCFNLTVLFNFLSVFCPIKFFLYSIFTSEVFYLNMKQKKYYLYYYRGAFNVKFNMFGFYFLKY